ncbi:MAG: hypothetical protein EOM15_02860 [Spirochaetia bacterium]|nr:hypothetical protein [Spirochaetia bacterium]
MYTYDQEVVDRHYKEYEVQKKDVDTVFSSVDSELRENASSLSCR